MSNVPDTTPEQLVATMRHLSERIVAQMERRTAIQTLRWLRHPGNWTAPAVEPTEAEIARFIAAARENPRIVPSFDPDDP